MLEVAGSYELDCIRRKRGPNLQKHSGNYRYSLCTTCFNTETSLYMAFRMYVWIFYDLWDIHWLFPDTVFNPLIFVIETVSVFY
jgi:hypothetical protein